MIRIQDFCMKNVVPSLPNLDLCRFAMTSNWSLSICLDEIKKRIPQLGLDLQAVFILNDRLSPILLDDIRNITVKTLTIFSRSIEIEENSLSFFYDLTRMFTHPMGAWPLTQKRLEVLENREKSDEFYSNLEVGKEYEKARPACIQLLAAYQIDKNKYEKSPHPYININVNRSYLSIGNLACFSAVGELVNEKTKDYLPLEPYLQPMDYFNLVGHAAIRLFAGVSVGANTTFLFEDLENQVRSLTQLRLLEVTVQNPMDPAPEGRMKSSFSAILAGAAELPNLKAVALEFLYVLSDLEISLFSEWVEKNPPSLVHISIQCLSVSLAQLQTLIGNLHGSLKKSIQLDVAVYRRHCVHLQEIAEHEEQLSTSLVDVHFRTII